jgi:hypothetical protein
VPTTVSRQSQFGLPGYDYYLPSNAPTSTQDMVIGFARSSGGDYFTVQPDPADPDNLWFVSEHSLGGTNWGTWVAEIQGPERTG